MDWKARLRAADDASLERISIYLADMTKDHDPVPMMEDWISDAMHLMADINGGATRLPVASGIWRKSDSSFINERTTLIFSNIMYPDVLESRFDELVGFLHKYGREAKQEAVMVEVSGGAPGNYQNRAYWIKENDYI